MSIPHKVKGLFKLKPYRTQQSPLRRSEENLLNTADYGRIKLIGSSLDNINQISFLNINNDKFNLQNIKNNINIEKDSDTNKIEMENIQIFNSLRIPDVVKDLPNFDGNPRTLYDFLSNVEEILTILNLADGCAYGKIILRAIRNKIIGQANEILNMYGTPIQWAIIKNNLITHYSDKRNETSLIRDLHLIKQGTETVEKYYASIIEIFSTMINHIRVHEIDINVIESKRKLYEEMCLNTFLSGLKEPLGSTIRAMQPKSLAEGLNLCLKEQNIYYIRGTQGINKTQVNVPQSNLNQQNFKFHNLPRPPLNSNQTNFKLTYPTNPYPILPTPNIPRFNNHLTRPNFSNNNYFKPPQFQPQRNLPLNQNHFRPTLNHNIKNPEPMDTSSANSKFRYNQPNYTPKFKSEELFNVESDRNPCEHYQNLDNFEEQTQTPQCEIDEQDFRNIASNNQSDI